MVIIHATSRAQTDGHAQPTTIESQDGQDVHELPIPSAPLEGAIFNKDSSSIANSQVVGTASVRGDSTHS
jgi:hypothetical protein